MITTEEMKEMIQEWMAQANSISELAKIYGAIISEAESQLYYMSESIEEGIREHTKRMN